MKKLTIGIILIIVAITSIFTMGMANADAKLTLATDSAYLVDYGSGKVLYENNADDKKEIASMVKIMTLLLTFEAIDSGKIKLGDSITISHEASIQTGSELFIDENSIYTISDLIKGIVVVSANDASYAIAETLAGSESAFVDMMNAKADKLGMANTKFANSTGFPSENEQYSTAKDVSIMTRELLKHKEYYNYSKIWLEDYTHPSGRITQLANTNKLVRFYKGCDSGKTGYTNTAKYCLSASAMRDGMRVVATVLGAEDSKSRFNSVTQLFNYAYANYKAKILVKQGDAVDMPIKISNAKNDTICPIASRDISALIGKNSKEWTAEYVINNNIVAPIAKGSKIGEAIVKVDGEIVDTVDLLAPTDIAKATYWDWVKKITKMF